MIKITNKSTNHQTNKHNKTNKKSLHKNTHIGVEHGFTKWDSRAYNKRADERSWRAAHEFLLDNIDQKYADEKPPSNEKPAWR